MSAHLIEEDLFVSERIIDPDSREGQRIHAFLLARAKLLAGRKVDFDKKPIMFVLSESSVPNAFFAPSPQEHAPPKRDENHNIRYAKNPLNIPVICVTKGLINSVDNSDQLDYVLAHELTHHVIRRYGVEGNSKGEELIADLHAADLTYDAGSDPKQALTLQDKLHEYTQQHAEKLEEQQRKEWDSNKTGIDWSGILDVHATYANTKTALEASLTRLSHLIDDRRPSAIDKTIFDAKYSDPVTMFLESRNFEKQKIIGKLRILIECFEHLSIQMPAGKYYNDKLAALTASLDPERPFMAYRLEDEREKMQKEDALGYPRSPQSPNDLDELFTRVP